MTRLLAALLLLVAVPAAAVLPSEQLKDPGLEARARAVSAGLRCVVCQNQSIDDSDAPLAHDLRVIVRERIVAGDSDAQAVQYLVDRYGHYVLLKPPFETATWLLWLGPALVLVVGGTAIAVFLRGRAGATVADLDPAEQAEVARLLGPERS